AHPQPLYATTRFEFVGYPDDFEHYSLWRKIAEGKNDFEHFKSEVLNAEDGGAGYRSLVGEVRLASLSASAHEGRAGGTGRLRVVPRRPTASSSNRPPLLRKSEPARPIETLVTLAARKIVERVLAEKYPTILAGIGHGFLAARMAKQW